MQSRIKIVNVNIIKYEFRRFNFKRSDAAIIVLHRKLKWSENNRG